MAEKYYRISKNQIIVDGKSNSCIYDLENKKLYHINHNLSNLLKRSNGKLDGVSEEERLVLLDLAEKGLRVFDKPNDDSDSVPLVNKPDIEFAWIEVCTKCNLRCIHCYNESDASCTNEMSYDDFVKVANILIQLGVKKVQFIGGEPLVIGDSLKEMIRYAYGKFEMIEIFTNGTLLDESWIKLFAEYKIRVALSVYSYIKEEHEKVTNVKNSFEKTNRAIEQLKEQDIRYRVCNTIMDKVSIGERNTDLYTLSERKDIVRMSGRGNLHLLNDNLIRKKLITKKTFSAPLHKAVVNRYILKHNCFGSKLYIASDLTVFPCVMERRFSHGKMSDNEFSLKKNILSMNKDKVKGCKECEFRYACFDCRPDSLTEEIYDKPWYCTYKPEEGTWETEEVALNRIKALDKTI